MIYLRKNVSRKGSNNDHIVYSYLPTFLRVFAKFEKKKFYSYCPPIWISVPHKVIPLCQNTRQSLLHLSSVKFIIIEQICYLQVIEEVLPGLLVLTMPSRARPEPKLRNSGIALNFPPCRNEKITQYLHTTN